MVKAKENTPRNLIAYEKSNQKTLKTLCFFFLLFFTHLAAPVCAAVCWVCFFFSFNGNMLNSHERSQLTHTHTHGIQFNQVFEWLCGLICCCCWISCCWNLYCVFCIISSFRFFYADSCCLMQLNAFKKRDRKREKKKESQRIYRRH